MHRLFLTVIAIAFLYSPSARSDIRLIGFPTSPGGGGDGPPPEVLGGYTMTPFPGYDGGPLGGRTDRVASPLGGEILFSTSLRRVSTFSVSWHPGKFDGNVYTDTELPGLIDITLPPKTRAFYIYGTTTSTGLDRIRATSQTGETLVELTTAFAGARGFGFYVTDPDEVLTTVRLSTDFALLTIGEFGIAIPEPATAGLVLGGAAFLRRRGASAR